jgi:molybdenum cofactor cytidylyltransferase
MARTPPTLPSTVTVQPFHALLLAAGNASRMSAVPKALCRLRASGKSLIRHCIDEVAASKVGDAMTVVIGGQHAALIRDHLNACNFSSVRICEVQSTHPGIGTSIAQGLSAALARAPGAPGPHVLIVLCDQPELRASHLDQLIAQHAGIPEQVVAASYTGGAKGPPMIWGSQYAPSLCSLSGEMGGKAILSTLGERLKCVKLEGFSGLDLDTIDQLNPLGLELP